MRSPWGGILPVNLVSKPIRGRILLVLTFSQNSQLLVNALISFYGISPGTGTAKSFSSRATSNRGWRLRRAQRNNPRQRFDQIRLKRLVSRGDQSRYQ